MKLTLYYAPNTCATVPYITLTDYCDLPNSEESVKKVVAYEKQVLDAFAKAA